jgi:hypothetical protein
VVVKDNVDDEWEIVDDSEEKWEIVAGAEDGHKA